MRCGARRTAHRSLAVGVVRHGDLFAEQVHDILPGAGELTADRLPPAPRVPDSSSKRANGRGSVADGKLFWKSCRVCNTGAVASSSRDDMWRASNRSLRRFGCTPNCRISGLVNEPPKSSSSNGSVAIASATALAADSLCSGVSRGPNVNTAAADIPSKSGRRSATKNASCTKSSASHDDAPSTRKNRHNASRCCGVTTRSFGSLSVDRAEVFADVATHQVRSPGEQQRVQRDRDSGQNPRTRRRAPCTRIYPFDNNAPRYRYGGGTTDHGGLSTAPHMRGNSPEQCPAS
ncbi:MAG: hypothetical protein ACI85K_002639 [Hyphomicrobiaceae bacterium]